MNRTTRSISKARCIVAGMAMAAALKASAVSSSRKEWGGMVP